MDLLTFVLYLVIALLVVGFAVWLIDKAPIDALYKTLAKGIIAFAVVIYLLLWLVQNFGHGGGSVHLP